MLNKHSKNCQRILHYFQIGKISPNLVTLFTTQKFPYLKDFNYCNGLFVWGVEGSGYLPAWKKIKILDTRCHKQTLTLHNLDYSKIIAKAPTETVNNRITALNLPMQ